MENDFTNNGDCWGEGVEKLINEAKAKVLEHNDTETISFSYQGVNFLAFVKPKKESCE